MLGPTGHTARARAILLGCLLGVGGLTLASQDPTSAARWVYRVTILARGGAFVKAPGAVLQSALNDCGPAALANLILTLGGSPPPVEVIGSFADTGARGTTFAGLSEAALRLGVPSILRRVEPASTAELSTPFIAWVDRGHYVTVVPDSTDSVLVLDPQAGPYRIRISRLARYWSGEALIPEPIPPEGEAASTQTAASGGLE
jgi:ABC-type bacteriocin/lantibiotic exporter with double-glycine peptidase domain